MGVPQFRKSSSWRKSIPETHADRRALVFTISPSEIKLKVAGDERILKNWGRMMALTWNWQIRDWSAGFPAIIAAKSQGKMGHYCSTRGKSEN